jgi:hypothetical protein
VTTVHILATIRKPELLPATLMVFDSIRIGFPTARICVRKNPTNLNMAELRKAANRVDANLYEPHSYQVMHEWIEDLVMRKNSGPFWICDTDMLFHSRVEDWGFHSYEPMVGRFIPQFFDPFTRRWTHQRLHTSLLWLNPDVIKEGIAEVNRITPNHPFKTQVPFFAPLYYSVRSEINEASHTINHWLHDTCSQLYHCVGGRRFTEQQNAAFDHLNCGTYSDLADENGIPGLAEKHRAVFRCPSLLKGAWKHQQKFYERYSSVSAARSP